MLGISAKVDGVRSYVEQGNKASPSDPDSIFLSARLAALDKDWPRVVAVLQAGEAAISNHHAAQALYGEALIEQGQGEAAVQRLTALHNQRIGDPVIRRLLARALTKTGEWAQVVSVLQPLIENASAKPEDLELFRRAKENAAKMQMRP